MAIITFEELADHLGVDDALDGMTFANAVDAANRAVVQWCGRNFDKVAVDSETARVFYPTTSWVVYVDDFHDTANLVVKTDQGNDGTYETTWAAADYQVEPLNANAGVATTPWFRLRAVNGRTFPLTRRPSVEVTAAWGWASVPGDVKQAALIKAARLVKRKDSALGVASFGQFGEIRVSRSEDPDVVLLLEPYVKADVLVA